MDGFTAVMFDMMNDAGVVGDDGHSMGYCWSYCGSGKCSKEGCPWVHKKPCPAHGGRRKCLGCVASGSCCDDGNESDSDDEPVYRFYTVSTTGEDPTCPKIWERVLTCGITSQRFNNKTGVVVRAGLNGFNDVAQDRLAIKFDNEDLGFKAIKKSYLIKQAKDDDSSWKCDMCDWRNEDRYRWCVSCAEEKGSQKVSKEGTTEESKQDANKDQAKEMEDGEDGNKLPDGFYIEILPEPREPNCLTCGKQLTDDDDTLGLSYCPPCIMVSIEQDNQHLLCASCSIGYVVQAYCAKSIRDGYTAVIYSGLPNNPEPDTSLDSLAIWREHPNLLLFQKIPFRTLMEQLMYAKVYGMTYECFICGKTHIFTNPSNGAPFE